MEEQAQRLIGTASFKRREAMVEANLDPNKNYNMNDKEEKVEETK